jgi:hypothetical protein
MPLNKWSSLNKLLINPNAQNPSEPNDVSFILFFMNEAMLPSRDSMSRLMEGFEI